MATTGQMLSMDALYQDETAAVESVLVVASSRKISFIPLSAQSGKGSGVVHFVPDADNRRGAITCMAVSDHDEGVLVTGHEKGSIVVWHNIVQFYLTALAQKLNSAEGKEAVSAPAGASGEDKKAEKKRIKKLKQVQQAESTVAMPLSTTLHWHAHSVHCVSLTADGTTLYSGGAEGVLVVWHNVNTSSSTGAAKSFFPRLGCPISFLTNNSSASLMAGINVAVTTTDNCVHVINTATMREDWTARSLCITSRRESVPRRKQLKHADADTVEATTSADPADHEEVDEHQYLGINRGAVSRLQAHTLPFIQSDYHWRCTLAVEPRSQWLVCNGYPGQLQAFDRTTQSLSHAYQVVDYTRVSKKETSSKMFVPSISHSQFLKHPLGWFLGTVDVRKGSELEAESSLKFFEWSDVQAKYRLGAQMDNPHGAYRVTALAFAGCPTEGPSTLNHHSVVCATASVDGTVKVWRAERNEVPAQPTLSTSAKRQQQITSATSSNTAANGGASSSSSAEAALPLKWVCAYSFKYRDSPATSVAFSRDGSLLAVAHRNLLSLWDPSNVSMKASIVCPTATSSSSDANSSHTTSNSILFTAFIEPKAAPALGGGCGCAYLFVGTQNSIAVYDLLTLKPVWTQSGEKYTAFAVAGDEKQLPSDSSEAWIAVSLTAATRSKAVVSSADTTDMDTDSEAAAAGEQHKVLLYSPFSSVPLATHTLPAKVSSLVFCPGIESSAEGSGRGVAAATESCEMLFLTLGGEARKTVRQLAAKVGEKAATVYKVSVPALATAQQGEVVVVGGKNKLSVQGAPLPNTKPGWLRDYFDEHSENIPSLAVISSGFFSNFRSAPPAPSSSSALAAAAAATVTNGATVSVSAVSGVPSSKASRKRSAQQISAPVVATVVPVSQQLWDDALVPFFSNPSAAAASSSAAAAAAAASSGASVTPVVPTTPAKKSLPPTTPAKKAAAPVVEVEATPPSSVVKGKKTPKKAAPVVEEPVVEEPAVVAASEPEVEVESEVVKVLSVKVSKAKSSKIPQAVVPSSLQTIQEDEEMTLEVAADTTEAAEVEQEEEEEAGAKRRKTASSASASTETDTPTTTAKASRAAASRIPARAPKVAASPSTTSSVVAAVPVPVPVTVEVATAAVAAKVPAPSKIATLKDLKLTKRTLPAATVKAVAADDSSDSSVSGLRRSSRARSGSNVSEDSVVSTGSATRKSARTSAQ